LTFSLFRENYWSSQLWEVRMDGTGLRPLLPGWNNPPNECCGSWTPDGKYFVFTATRENQSHVWAIRESGRSFDQDRPVPVQLTSGPTQFRRAVPSLDGRRLFAIGWHLRGELTRFDGQLGRLESYMSGLSAEWVDHSPDGRWITYVTYPEAELWRSRVDGTERLQLTAAPLRAIAPKWSPDSAQIAFAGHHPGEEPNVLLVSKEGGGYRQVIAGMDPTWSPDGSSIAVETKTGIQIVDVHTGRATKILAGTRFFSPRWSPDGRRLAAISVDKWKVAIYEFQTGRWSELGPEWTALPIWSRDGKSLFCRDDVRPNIARGVYRLRMPAYRPEHVMIFEQVRLVWGTVPFWIGLTSDDSLLFLRDLSSHELYALDWEAP
jgi:Tol biopolymer transport system component